MGIRLIFAGLCAILPAFAQGTITLTPSPASVHVGGFLQFTARISGATSTGVNWSLTPAGAASGTINASGRYAPPAALPVPNTITVTATSASPAISASVTLTILNPYPALASVSPANIPIGSFPIALNGSGFVPGAVAIVDGIPAPTIYVSPTKLTATLDTHYSHPGSKLPIVVQNPDPGATASTNAVSLLVGPSTGLPILGANIASHFLDQAAFGPDAATLDHLQTAGLDDYLEEQFAAPISHYPEASTIGPGINRLQSRFFTNAVHGEDQLRQRVAFALGQIFVVSGIQESTPDQLAPYLEILQNDAFVNFRTLMEDVTLSPTMGEYLDMRNNDKADLTRGIRANENYARELMQLFTIGLYDLNLDGTYRLDTKGEPIPTYDQTTIQNFAKVYTGWTYPTKPGTNLQKHNPAYFVGPMVYLQSNHDVTSKTLLNGVVLLPGQTAAQDLKAALDNIFNHPNVGPFIGKQLIQHLVSSNPSPSYVARVATVFNDNGAGVRGDLKAVLRAILLDPEARQGDNGPFVEWPNFPPSSHLREPVFVVVSILRGLNASVNDTNTLTTLATNLGQTLFSPASVFNYFAPGYQIPAQFTPGTSLLGPEFQLNSPSNAVARFNMVNSMIYGNLGTGAVIDFTPFSNLAGNPAALVGAVSRAFLYGQMPPKVENALLGAVSAITGSSAAVNKSRAQAAIYLAVSSSIYNVQH